MWFGQNYGVANGGSAASYLFGGPGNPSGVSSGLGGLVSLIFPDRHGQTSHTDKDLGVYQAFYFSQHLIPSYGKGVGFNVIGVNRATNLIIIVKKADGFTNSGTTLFDLQATLLNAGTDYALVTDGGQSTACWFKDKGYLTLGKRHSETPDATNTISNYIIFSPVSQ